MNVLLNAFPNADTLEQVLMIHDAITEKNWVPKSPNSVLYLLSIPQRSQEWG